MKKCSQNQLESIPLQTDLNSILTLLRERCKRYDANMRKSFIRFAHKTNFKEKTGKKELVLTKDGFLSTLDSFGIYLADENLKNELLRAIGFKTSSEKEKLSYLDFVKNLEDSQIHHIHTLDDAIKGMSNHTIKHTVSKKISNAKELADMVKTKVRQKFTNLYSIFSKYAERNTQQMFLIGFIELLHSMVLIPDCESTVEKTMEILGHGEL